MSPNREYIVVKNAAKNKSGVFFTKTIKGRWLRSGLTTSLPGKLCRLPGPKGGLFLSFAPCKGSDHLVYEYYADVPRNPQEVFTELMKDLNTVLIGPITAAGCIFIRTSSGRSFCIELDGNYNPYTCYKVDSADELDTLASCAKTKLFGTIRESFMKLPRKCNHPALYDEYDRARTSYIQSIVWHEGSPPLSVIPIFSTPSSASFRRAITSIINGAFRDLPLKKRVF